VIEQAYNFRSGFPDVDFRRILAENPDADFIVVRWALRGGTNKKGLVLVSEHGADRMSSAGISGLLGYRDVGLSKDGKHWRDGPERDPVYVIRDIDLFYRMLAEIKKQEKQRHWIEVTAIR